jgi:hypothetical protein
MASVSELTYDLWSVLQSKLEARAVRDMYVKDVHQPGDKQAETLLASLKRDDEKHIDEWPAAPTSAACPHRPAAIERRPIACDITSAES